MKIALIFLHGDLSNLQHAKTYASQAELIICADGGAEYALQAQITPHVVIGDMDSIPASVRNELESKVKWLEYPPEKNETDAELAIQYALDHGASQLVIFGFFGHRFDHMMTNILYFSSLPAQVVICEGPEEYRFVKEKLVLKGKKGDELSLIPLEGTCEGVTTSNLYYALNDFTLPFGTTRGISNVFEAETAEVSLKKGVLLAIHTRK